MKEEIERRRAEAAEKRQKMPEDGVSEDKKPFKCFSPKGSSLKVTPHQHLYRTQKLMGLVVQTNGPTSKAKLKYL